MKRIITLIFAIALLSHGAAITYTEKFDAVEVLPPAKSQQIICKTRVDANEGLVRNYACDVSEIEVLNADHMWIGSLDAIPAFESRKYQEFDDGKYRKLGKYIEVRYYRPTVSAYDTDASKVICPAGMIPYQEGNAYTCIKPYQCEPGEYAEDAYSCNTLPANAHRTHTVGYECNAGAKRDSYGDCIVPPENAHWVKNGEWVCNAGLVELNGICVEKATCDDTERYDDASNTCVKLPENAHWNDLTSQSVEWACNEAFVEINSQCVPKAVCTGSQRYEITQNACVALPENAHWISTFGTDWACDDRYTLTAQEQYPYNSACKLAYNCEVEHAHWSSYYGMCITAPEHSHWTSDASTDWECDDGYIQEMQSCTKKAVCDPTTQRYVKINNSCATLPNNAKWDYDRGDSWSCIDGYVNIAGHCEEKNSCYLGNRLDTETNTCVNKPAHSSWTDGSSTEWYCDNDYYRYGDECKANPWLLKDHIAYGARFVFNMAAGEAWTDSSSGSNEFAFNISVGFEAYLGNLGNNVSFALVPTVGYLLFDTYDATLNVFRAELGTRLSVGGSILHGYIMPMAMLNVVGSITINEHDARQIRISPKSNDYSLGSEMGVSVFTNGNYRWDAYVRFETTPLSVTYISRDDWLVMVGLRIGI